MEAAVLRCWSVVGLRRAAGGRKGGARRSKPWALPPITGPGAAARSGARALEVPPKSSSLVPGLPGQDDEPSPAQRPARWWEILQVRSTRTSTSTSTAQKATVDADKPALQVALQSPIQRRLRPAVPVAPWFGPEASRRADHFWPLGWLARWPWRCPGGLHVPCAGRAASLFSSLARRRLDTYPSHPSRDASPRGAAGPGHAGCPFACN